MIFSSLQPLARRVPILVFSLAVIACAMPGCAPNSSDDAWDPVDIGSWQKSDAIQPETDVQSGEDVPPETFETWVKPSEIPPCVQAVGDSAVGTFFTKGCTPSEACACANVDGGELISQLLGKAQNRVDVCVMELQDFSVSDALVSCKNRQVSSRVVVDDSYADPNEEPAMKVISQAGIPVVHDDDDDALMHSKFIIVDERWVLVSSANFSTYDAQSNANNTLVFDSPELADLFQRRFDTFFQNHQFHDTAQVNDGVVQVNGHDVEVYFGPYDDNEASWKSIQRLEQAIYEAQDAVHFSIFAFTLEEIKDALQERCGEIELVGLYDAEQADDWNSVKFHNWCPQATLLPANVQGDWGFKKLHHKVLIADPGTQHGLVVTGSTNWSYSAAAKNDEVMVVVHDPDVVEQFEAEFQSRLQEAK